MAVRQSEHRSTSSPNIRSPVKCHLECTARSRIVVVDHELHDCWTCVRNWCCASESSVWARRQQRVWTLNADCRCWSNKQTSTRQHSIGITYHDYSLARIASICIRRHIYCDVDRRHAAMDDFTMQPPAAPALVQTREAAQRA